MGVMPSVAIKFFSVTGTRAKRFGNYSRTVKRTHVEAHRFQPKMLDLITAQSMVHVSLSLTLTYPGGNFAR